ncbi:MAG: bifunctional methylenetetrahydrofolate dehydrogenase/methenyltetrahydrofolate cyclohydrolase FolD [Burkholderiales bacterium]|nr:bifunctional methylenetetrahydrofolate dehydrogenase/methenyltetrahydrofolate cyclohydrolase FolD [Burkholderiales bacterium]OUT76825.1 MAG: bifunctional methylenetetrahydrofolate dehydrogenase/methenyltetrahydrofolate cyclohydrolase [Betaproteobacteria bacterium TMED22]|tara:strand:- start:23944 stop:24801 length:858 start_codon:yes stop_codon:yes gene_type:complete
MSAKVVDGKLVSRELRARMKDRVGSLMLKDIKPGLAVILVGDDAASQVYVRNKIRACDSVGVNSTVKRLATDCSEKAVLNELIRLNNDPGINGILVQLPLPKHIDEHKILETIRPEKDVDGFHKVNVGAMVTGNATFYPCTPHGVMKLLDYYNVRIEGRHAVVIGRSNIVGKPMALMLLERGATVSICNSKTPDLSIFTRQADIVVTAVGKLNVLEGGMIKPGAAVIDVGINRLKNGSLAGDVDYESVRTVAGFVTPVPGGVGPMTITMLLENTIRSAEITNFRR